MRSLLHFLRRGGVAFLLTAAGLATIMTVAATGAGAHTRARHHRHVRHSRAVTHRPRSRRHHVRVTRHRTTTTRSTTAAPTVARTPTTAATHASSSPSAVTPSASSTASRSPTVPVASAGATSSTTAPASTATPTTSTAQSQAGDTKTPCVYASDHISMLNAFGSAVGRAFQCAMVFNDAATTWSGWVDPWFINRTYADMSWASWATTPGAGRQLVITQNLFPSSENSANWLSLGASGAFEGYAQQLATNLVNAGLGSSIIRLAHEANGNWYPDSIPNTPTGDAEWIQFWRNTVIAMRSVPGAHFQFDWCVNAGYRNIPLSNWYPGDDVVNIIGIDAYDSGVPGNVPFANRWNYLYNEADGLGAVEAFAVAHGKPLSIPEWGLGPANQPGKGQGGDDPAYVRGIASVVANDDVAYQSYFDSGQEGMQFFNSPQSMQAYQQAFAPGGTVATPQDTAASGEPAPSQAPSLALTGGPADASAIASDSTTFTFTVQAGYAAQCSLDGEAWRACSTATSDTLQNLSSGYHYWNVKVTDSSDRVTLLGRDFMAPATS